MKTYQKIAVLLCAGLFGLSTIVSAQFTYDIALTGDEAGVSPSGSGTATGSLDLDTNLLTWDITFTDLTSDLTAAHFHGPADVGENAGVLVDLDPQAGALGETTGSWVGQTTVSNAIRDDIVAHMTYINLHTVNNGGGEIRGQVVPEPGTYALFAGMFTLLGAWFWRRRARR